VKDELPLRRLLIGALVAATLFYILGFALNEHLRTRRGPWVVSFTASPTGQPRLSIQQPSLGIRSVIVTFAGEEAIDLPPTTVRFETPRMALPFGTVKYDDLTYLPGVVTFEAFGHEIELLPRVLYLNRNPIEWADASNVVLHPQDRLPKP
jgi:hypothetical protein